MLSTNEEHTNIHFIYTFCYGNSPDAVKELRPLSESLPTQTKQYSAVHIRFCEKQIFISSTKDHCIKCIQGQGKFKIAGYCVSAVNDGETEGDAVPTAALTQCQST